jgi:hypothetical protein
MCSVQLLYMWLAYLGTINSLVITCHMNYVENKNPYILITGIKSCVSFSEKVAW